MAKKKPPKKGKGSKPKKGKPKARTPRSQALPGMEQVRDRVLDNLCESIGDQRETMNEARGQEQSMIGSALKRMVDKSISVYKHGGIELARVPGAEKLRVRLVKERGDADASDLATPDEGGDEGGVTNEEAAGGLE